MKATISRDGTDLGVLEITTAGLRVETEDATLRTVIQDLQTAGVLVQDGGETAEGELFDYQERVPAREDSTAEIERVLEEQGFGVYFSAEGDKT